MPLETQVLRGRNNQWQKKLLISHHELILNDIRFAVIPLFTKYFWEPKNPITGELHIKRHSDLFSGANNHLTEVLPVSRTHRKTFQGDYWLQWPSNQHEGSKHPLI